jgi:two-component system response regulator YesN
MRDLDGLQDIEAKIFGQPLQELIIRINFKARLKRAWQVIETEYANPKLNLERTARASGVSQNHLNVLFRQKTSFTFYQLLTRYRLIKAIAAMQDRNFNLLEIAGDNGFTSIKAFQRNFSVILETTPQEVRKKLSE